MATITLNIPTDAELTRIVDAFCSIYNYDANKLANETKGAFAKRMVANYVARQVQIKELSDQKKALNISAINVT